MKRREFLVRAGQTVIAFPMVLTAVSCGEDSGPSAPQDPPTSFDVISKADATGHRHTITITCTDLSGGQLEYPSSSTGHTHSVTLQSGDPTRILNGTSVDAPGSLVDNHTHTWMIQKPTNVECT